MCNAYRGGLGWCHAHPLELSGQHGHVCVCWFSVQCVCVRRLNEPNSDLDSDRDPDSAAAPSFGLNFRPANK